MVRGLVAPPAELAEALGFARAWVSRDPPMVTWADEAIRMFTDRALGPLTARDVHVLIDWIDELPELAHKLEELDRESLRQELWVLALRLLEARQTTPLPFRVVKRRAWPTR